MNKTKYEKYKELKAQFDFEYRGFNMGQVMAMDIAELIYNIKIRIYIRYIIKFLFTLIDLKKLSIHVKKNEVFYTYSTDRNDYEELVKSYMKKLGNSSNILCINKMKKISFNIKYIFESVKQVISIDNTSFSERIYLILLLNYYKTQINMLLSVDFNSPKQYIAFNSSVRIETLLSLYFNMKKIPTFSLQHGLYYVFNKPIPLDIINYENISANKILCWGQYTIDEMIKFGIERTKLELFGNPKYDSIIEYKKNNLRFKRCLVPLSRIIYHEGNLKLLELLSNFKEIEFDVKMHPSLNMKMYKVIISNYKNMKLIMDNRTIPYILKNNYDFVISYNTTVHYEAILNGLITFAFNHKNDGGLLFEKFSDKDSLYLLIQKYEKLTEVKVNLEMKKFVQYTMGVY